VIHAIVLPVVMLILVVVEGRGGLQTTDGGLRRTADLVVVLGIRRINSPRAVHEGTRVYRQPASLAG